MNKISNWKKALMVLAIGGGSIAAWEGGSAIVADVQFARAEQQVASSNEQLQKVQDLSDVFRNVGRVIEPSVVQIEVKTEIRGGRSRFFGPNDDLRKFFQDHGFGQMPGDQDNNGDQNNDNNDQNQNDSPDDNGGDDLEQIGTGSGVIMEVDGSDAYILTNNHVAGDAKKMTVTLNDGRMITNGKTVGADAKSDLAVVKITADHLIAAKWGDSDQLDRGDWVLAFGSPFRYVGSMTHGIVSALHRTDVHILPQEGYENFIQVDAPINPGNSGGPLVNIHGEVIGINTAIASESGGFQGIGFAIPSDEARPIFAMLKEKGKVTRGWLGVEIQDVQRDPDFARSFGYTETNGVIVHGVLNGTPAAGKLQPGDVITALDGKHVDTVQELRDSVAMMAPGSAAKLTISRDGKESEITVMLGEQPDNPLAMNSNAPARHSDHAAATAVRSLGLQLSDLTDDLAQKYGLGSFKGGALVVNVNPNSPAGRVQMQIGDLITRVNGQSVGNAEEASAALAKADLNKGIQLQITNREGYRAAFLESEK